MARASSSERVCIVTPSCSFTRVIVMYFYTTVEVLGLGVVVTQFIFTQ